MKPTDQNIENALKEAGIVGLLGLVRWLDTVTDLVDNNDLDRLDELEVEIDDTASMQRQLVTTAQMKLLKTLKNLMK